MGWSTKASITIVALAALAKPAGAYDCAGFGKEGGLTAVAWEISSPRAGRTDVRLTFRNDFDHDIEGVLAQAYIDGSKAHGELVAIVTVGRDGLRMKETATAFSWSEDGDDLVGIDPASYRIAICVGLVEFTNGEKRIFR